MLEHERHNTVKLTINHHHVESPAHTTGAALYELGHVPADDTLYLETVGLEDDKPIPRDGAQIHLRGGDKLYSEPGPASREVEIVIDTKHHDSPRETTGAALHALGQVPPTFTLYRETAGRGEDSSIANDATAILVHKHEKFYSEQRVFTIIVNGRKKEVTAKELPYQELLTLAFGNNVPAGPNIVITVTYSKGEGGKHGSLLPGDKVKIKKGMIFNVTATDKS